MRNSRRTAICSTRIRARSSRRRRRRTVGRSRRDRPRRRIGGRVHARRTHPHQQPRRRWRERIRVTLPDGRSMRPTWSATTPTPTWRFSWRSPGRRCRGRRSATRGRPRRTGRHRHRQSVRLPHSVTDGRRQRARPVAARAVGPPDGRHHPDRRRAQSGQLGRAARHDARRGHRRQHGDDPAGAGTLLRDCQQHGAVRRVAADSRRPHSAQLHRRRRAERADSARDRARAIDSRRHPASWCALGRAAGARRRSAAAGRRCHPRVRRRAPSPASTSSIGY